MRIQPIDTGSVMGAFDQETNIGLTVQPLFKNNDSSPEMIIVGSWFPMGMLKIYRRDKAWNGN